ncbi:hypothetical protein [Tropheryma whipplei]|uniref:hypothetical protein n=1 Tax=Tropheryma whipplei TaxID=2039 RepID=UPI0011D1497B|nr:hypothetical protein [Tropheryma whipplei]
MCGGLEEAVADRDGVVLEPKKEFASPLRALVMAPAAALVMLPNRSPQEYPDDCLGADTNHGC